MLVRLAAALDAVDLMPGSIIAAAKATLTWRTVDAEWASLVVDFAAEELAGVR